MLEKLNEEKTQHRHFNLRHSDSGAWLKTDCPRCRSTIHLPDEPNLRTRRTCRQCKYVWSFVRRRTEDGKLEFISYLISSPRPPTTYGHVPAAAPQPKPQNDEDLMTKIKELVERSTRDLKNLHASIAEEVRAEALKIARAEAEKLAPVTRQLKAPTKREVTINGARHQAYDEVLYTISAIGKALLVGPAGSGKSSLVRQIAEDLELDFGYLPCTEGMSEAQILGRVVADGTYLESDFVRIFEGGGVFLFDEVDAADPNVLLVINEALANGFVAVPNRVTNPTARAHDDFVAICAANTYGTGGDLEYVGRNQLDAAFLDRFAGGIVNVDYDRERERKIAEDFGIEKLLPGIWKIRENVQHDRIRRPVTTRWVLHLGKISAVLEGELSNRDLIDRAMRGWSEEEKKKAFRDVLFEDEISDDELSSLDSSVKCPNCNGPMVVRVATRGRNEGKKFFGCSQYPNCTGTQPYYE